ncbi:uncharacterized protein G2W53_019168 [Senna tora]|uniref:Uncharacterized protein n=1 Tax=Senna tora TaxID=362788 RepID=A0A834WRV9_9FABA|nr:uncharacterized protein G2W53_019168 [Senna tora]
MGTKVQNLPGYYSMRDLNEESSSCGWPRFYGDKTLTNGQYYSNYMSSTDACSAYDKDLVKRTMLEHEAVFKNQVYELHRLYRKQRDLMDEVKRKEFHRNQMPVESSFSTGHFASQITSEDGQKWHIPGFPMPTSVGARPSISGIEGIHSPLGSAKGNSKQAGLFPSPNGSSSKDVEVLECRPSKVRRKMFDLHLPADAYIDTEESEKFSDEKISGTTIYLPDRDCKLRMEGDVKLVGGTAGKASSQEDTSRCEQSLRSRNGLADLNEPVLVEESNASAYVHHLDHNLNQRETECADLSAQEKSRLFGFPREDSIKSHHGTSVGPRNNGYMENNGSGKWWIPSVLEEAGQAKSNLKPIPQVLKQEKSILSSQTMRDALCKVHEPPSDYLSNRRKVDMWRDKTVYDLEIGERRLEISTNKHPDSVVSPHRSSLFAVTPSSNLVKSLSHSASSWEMGKTSSSQKLMSAQNPSLNAYGALNKSYQSGQSNGILGDSWSNNIDSKYSPGFRCEAPVQNGLYHGFSSGSKEPSVNVSSVSYDYLNHNSNCKVVPDRLINHGSAKYCNGSNCNETRSGKDINLNVMLSSDSSEDIGVMDGEQKHEEHLAVLPWLRAKMAFKNDVQNAGRGITGRELSFSQAASMSEQDETGKGPNGTSVLCSNGVEPRKIEVGDRTSNKKILGVPIFDMPHISPKKESSASASLSVPIPNSSDVKAVERKNRVFDINLPCDAAVIELDKETVSETSADKKGSPKTESNCRNLIDLNLSMSEDEASLITIPSTNIRKVVEIDLEAPPVPEMEEDIIPEEKLLETPSISSQVLQSKDEKPQDELIVHAAEAIVAISSLSCNQVVDVISSPSESPKMADPLGWFANVVSSCTDHLEVKLNSSGNAESSSQGLDYFESMTLNLTETKEEDYMPTPLVPENINLEETGATVLPTRTRRGPARRGRQRRDFQRDILPGLASLSRHEVTEDLQTFGGLMRATGHSWQSGLTRRSSSRNGCGRGRRRLQQLNNIDVGLEDRSLTGWGKTTRRPRRQRCPAGNPPPIQSLT